MHKVAVPYEIDRVQVIGPTGNLDTYRWADVMFTHLDYTHWTLGIAGVLNRPVVHFVHNDTPYHSIINTHANTHVVYNSKWIADKLNYNWPSMVLPPPVDVDYYNVCNNPEANEFITLISLNENKGGKLLYRIADALPDKKFLGVIGSYDPQIIHQQPNITIVPNTPDILSVYRKTRILLMPSRYESWGMTATEAMCSGIPVISTGTPGLKENCYDAGLYIPNRVPLEFDTQGKLIADDSDGYDIKPIIKHIRALDDKNYYSQVSHKCRERAGQHRAEPHLAEFETFLNHVISTRQVRA
jgi:glycosyltransferase involved in cell wall biosynthesis